MYCYFCLFVASIKSKCNKQDGLVYVQFSVRLRERERERERERDTIGSPLKILYIHKFNYPCYFIEGRKGEGTSIYGPQYDDTSLVIMIPLCSFVNRLPYLGVDSSLMFIRLQEGW